MGYLEAAITSLLKDSTQLTIAFDFTVRNNSIGNQV